MVSNIDLFRKIMMFSKEMRHSAIKAAEGEHGGCGHGHMRHDHEEDRPPFPPDDMGGMPPFPPMGPGERPPFPPHMFGRGPGRHGMAREHLLAILNEFPDGARQKELAEKAGINASSTSEVVSKLEDEGYIVRTVDENDKRATVLKLTEMGKVRADEIREEREAILDNMFSKLTEEEKQTLSDLLDKMMA